MARHETTKRRPFCDNAGYMRHCWECHHAHNWTDGWLYGYPWADCDMHDMHAVSKYSSPNNGCSWMAGVPALQVHTTKEKREIMSERITKELRAWGRDFFESHNEVAFYGSTFYAIADRIDEAHARSYREQVDSAESAAWESVLNADDEELERHGLVRLPVDADGEPIKRGESVIYSECTYKVKRMNLYYDGWMVMIGRDGVNGFEVDPEKIHHYKPTPAERIRDVVNGLNAFAGPNSTDDEQDNAHELMGELLAIADELEGDGND